MCWAAAAAAVVVSLLFVHLETAWILILTTAFYLFLLFLCSIFDISKNGCRLTNGFDFSISHTHTPIRINNIYFSLIYNATLPSDTCNYLISLRNCNYFEHRIFWFTQQETGNYSNSAVNYFNRLWSYFLWHAIYHSSHFSQPFCTRHSTFAYCFWYISVYICWA